MTITWLGESGFVLEDGVTSIILDPYFSDALARRKSGKSRMLPPVPAFTSRSYDLMLMTHCHIDHTDPETVELLLGNNPRMILAGPLSSYNILKEALRGAVYTQVSVGSLLSVGEFRVTAQPAIHSDPHAVGYLIERQNKRYYFCGDTALLCGLQDRVPHATDVAFLCFNGGVGKNMDIADALRLATTISPRCVVPFHYGVIPGEANVELFLKTMLEAGFRAIKPEYCKPLPLD